MKKFTSIALAVAGLVGTCPAAAEKTPKSETSKSGAAKSEVRKDPKGVTGISPAKAAIAEGRAAFERKNYGTALSHFERALAQESDKALSGYLIAQVKSRLGDIPAALQAVKAARAASPQAPLAAKLLFVEAQLLEERANVTKADSSNSSNSLRDALVTSWEAARDAWTAYAVYLRVNTTLPDHKATAEDRRAKIAARQERQKVYGQVRSRIETNAKNRAAKAKGKK